MQEKHHKAMWCNDQKYCTTHLGDKKKTCDSGIPIIFLPNISHKGDKNSITYHLRYYDCLEDILKIDFLSYKVVFFKVRWCRLLLQGDERITICLTKHGIPT
jgi:hypothetical protein